LEELRDPMQLSIESAVLPPSLSENDVPIFAQIRHQQTRRRRRRQNTTELPGWLWALICTVIFLLFLLILVAIFSA
jgi:hypothetical protein